MEPCYFDLGLLSQNRVRSVTPKYEGNHYNLKGTVHKISKNNHRCSIGRQINIFLLSYMGSNLGHQNPKPTVYHINIKSGLYLKTVHVCYKLKPCCHMCKICAYARFAINANQVHVTSKKKNNCSHDLCKICEYAKFAYMQIISM